MAMASRSSLLRQGMACTRVKRQSSRCQSTTSQPRTGRRASQGQFHPSNGYGVRLATEQRQPQQRQPPPPPPPQQQEEGGGQQNSIRVLGGLMGNWAAQRRPTDARKSTLEEVELLDQKRALEKHAPRRWRAGDVYAPHDLSSVEAKKWKKKAAPGYDVFDELGINPLDEYKNFSIMSDFMTDTGRIKHSSDTGLRPVNQRRVAKAIRRAVGLGLMPSVHHHPEILDLQSRTSWAKSGRLAK